MKILIATDMEGISGVVNWDQVDPGHAEYTRFRKIMTNEVNAAIRGAFEGGATEVIVTDGHDHGNNILIEELDSRARLNTGNSTPLAMVQGIETSVDGAMFIGYHARAGTQNAILDHTWSSKRVANLWLNELLVGEFGLNAAVCGHFEVPIILVSGDQSVCEEAAELAGSIETVVVKHARGRMSAECAPPQVTQGWIEVAAARAVRRLAGGDRPAPLRVSAPVRVTVEFMQSDYADKALLLPGASRPEGRRIAFSTEDMPAAYLGFQAAVGLAWS